MPNDSSDRQVAGTGHHISPCRAWRVMLTYRVMPGRPAGLGQTSVRPRSAVQAFLDGQLRSTIITMRAPEHHNSHAWLTFRLPVCVQPRVVTAPGTGTWAGTAAPVAPSRGWDFGGRDIPGISRDHPWPGYPGGYPALAIHPRPGVTPRRAITDTYSSSSTTD